MAEIVPIGLEVKKLSNEINSFITARRIAAGDELTMMQSWIIGYIYRTADRDVFQKDVEAKFSIARSTATGILQLMEKKGYLIRETLENDARLKRLVLTDKGKAADQIVRDSFDEAELMMREGISEEDMDTFFRVIRQMRGNLERDNNATDRRRTPC